MEVIYDNTHACLSAWNEGVRLYLERTNAARYADDVSQQYALELLEKKEHEGQAVPNWPGELSKSECKRAIRMARKMTDVVVEPSEERVQPCLSCQTRSHLGVNASKKLKKGEDEFTTPQWKQMLSHCGENEVTQKSLAKAAGMPYRTLKHKFRKIRL